MLMDLKNYKPVFNLLIISLVLYLLHKTFFYVFKTTINIQSFHYSLETLYLFFIICSTTILFILIKIKQKSLDNVGMAFLMATSIKMVFCYIMLRPILNNTGVNNSIEKTNFFVMFILFLAIETIVTIRILNNKQ